MRPFVGGVLNTLADAVVISLPAASVRARLPNLVYVSVIARAGAVPAENGGQTRLIISDLVDSQHRFVPAEIQERRCPRRWRG